MQTELLRKQTAVSAENVVPPSNGESDKYDLQGLGRTKNLEQLSAYVTLSTD